MALVHKDLVRPDRAVLPGQEAFRFRHLLIRDAAYQALAKADRAELHERFARWLEVAVALYFGIAVYLIVPFRHVARLLFRRP
jgi:hypothetical protein